MENKEKNLTLTNLSEEKINLLKKTICKGATDDQFTLFLHACNRCGLDPFMKQIYAVMRNSKEGVQMTIQTSIDGYRLIAERTGKYAPGREPTYVYTEKKELESATSYIKKQTTDGSWHEISASAYYDEYVQKFNDKPSNFWAKMPHLMLAKCAEALALRKAFPAELSGVYTEDEMAQADVPAEEAITLDELEVIESLLLEFPDKRENLLKLCKNNLSTIPRKNYKKVIDWLNSPPKQVEQKEAFNGGN